MTEEKLRLGGMALRNGVLVHGPTSWACAVRLPDGTLKVAAERKMLIGNTIENPLLRGPARLLEAVAVLPATAFAVPCSSVFGCGGKPAPAPLLAAGIPAFVALGGGAAVARLIRRRRERDDALRSRDAAGNP